MKRALSAIIVAVNILLISPKTYAQTDATELVGDIIEEMAVDNSDEEDSDWSQQLELLAEQYEQPLNLNVASCEELERFPFLTPQQAWSIHHYIATHGQMVSLSELMLVDDMDRKTIERLKPFVCAQPVDKSVKCSLAEMARYGRHEVVARMDIPFYQREGYSSAYLGPSLYSAVKYKFSYKKKISFGLSAEKDAGEPFGALCNRKGFDYYSAHLLITDIGLLKTLIVGDYGLHFGQGLVVNTDFSLDNSSYIFSSPFVTGGISKHTSVGESNYFCGAAADIQPARNWIVSPFYSRRLIDGNVNEAGELTSITTTGLHRTASEIERQHSATLQVGGANVRFARANLHIGLTAIYYWLSRNYQPSLTGYRLYNIHGNNFYNVGIDYGYRLRRFTLQGEMAKGKHGVAFVNKLRYDSSGGYHLLLLHRYYSHDYWNMFASAFARGSSVSNENGWFVAADLPVSGRTALFASIDMVSFPWKRYRISRPSNTLEARLRATYTATRNLSFSADYRFRMRDRDKTGSGGAVVYTYCQHRLRLKLNYQPSDWLALRTVAECNNFYIHQVESDWGFRATQSATFRLFGQRLKLQPQLTFFCTDNYDTRVFVAESGMLYSGYSSSFYGRGLRYSLNASYALSKRLKAMCRLSETCYLDRSQIGTGNDMIPSNRKTDLQLLIQCKF